MSDLAQLEASLIDAFNRGDAPTVRATGLQIAEYAGTDFPAFHAILNALGYHNQLSLINDMMRLAWPQVENEPTFSRPAVEAYAARATDHLIYAYLEQEPRPEAAGDALLQELEAYFAVDAARLQSYLRLLSGEVGRPWSMPDFEPLQMPALSGLLVEFMGYASRAELPYARAHLVREQLPRYLLDRQAGNLQPKPDMAAALRQAQRPFPQIPPEPLHPLAPDRPSLELFLQRMLQTITPQSYAAAAILECLPHWLDFLEVRELLPADIAQRSMEFLPELRRNLSPFWADHPDVTLRNIG